MRKVKLFVPITLVLLFAGGVQAAPVDSAEVLRLGDMVQHVDGNRYGQAAEDEYIEALKPPASDADKWFISVITSRGCEGCVKLKDDFGKSPWLLALANPNDTKKSWSHFSAYDIADRSQSWRWAGIKITGYPTILVQPPRSGKYGDSSTVVYQGTYGGDPKELASEITGAIRMYVDKLGQGYSQHSVAPPWEPAPKVDHTLPWRPDEGGGRLIPPLVPDEVAIEVNFPWKAVLTLLAGGFSIPAIIALVVWLLVFVRAGRKEADKPLLLSDEVFKKLLDTLEGLSNSQQPKAGGTKRSTTRK